MQLQQAQDIHVFHYHRHLLCHWWGKATWTIGSGPPIQSHGQPLKVNDPNLTTHSLCIGGTMLWHHNGEEKLEICCLGHWTDDTIFKYFCTDLLLDPNELCKIRAYKRVRQQVLHFFCSCKVDPNNPGGDARISRRISPFHNADTSLLDDTTKLLTYQKCRNRHLHYAQQYAYITPHLHSTHAFVKSKLEATTIVSPNVIDWHYITEHFDGDKLWFSLSVWMAKCHWKWWESRRVLPQQQHPQPINIYKTQFILLKD